MVLRMFLEKLKSAGELAHISGEMGRAGRKMVFTNGCFDVLHLGHVRYLQQARQLGDALVIALNSDESVRALKGETRPINSQSDRAEILSALTCVDYVTIFTGEDVRPLLREIRPQVYAKGGDYTIDSLNAKELVVLRELAIEVKILSLVPGKSTTALLEQMESATEGNSTEL